MRLCLTTLKTNYGESPDFKYDFLKYDYTVDEKKKMLIFDIKSDDIDYSIRKMANDEFRHWTNDTKSKELFHYFTIERDGFLLYNVRNRKGNQHHSIPVLSSSKEFWRFYNNIVKKEFTREWWEE